MAGGSGKLAQSNRTRLSWFSTGGRMSDATTNSSRLSLPASDDASAEKKKKKERATRPKLTPDLLLSDDGIGFVLRYFPKAFKPRARPGHEVPNFLFFFLFFSYHSLASVRY